MTPHLPPYSAYKPSGVDWLGDVPTHWDLIPNRGLMTLKKDIVGPRADDYVLLSLTKRGVIARDIEKSGGKFPASFETYQVVEPGDLVFCLFDIDETPRTVGLANIFGMITGAYSRFVCPDKVLRKFLYYLYLSLDDGKLLKPLYSGLRKVIPKFTFLRAKVALPPRSEQAAIVGYLDHADRRIQRYIEAKEKLIALLQEARQAIIQRAVTRGLDPDVPLKPSGVDWLGKVPAHWEVRRLRTVGEAIIGLTYSPQDVVEEGEGILVFRASNISEGRIVFGDNVFVRTSVPDRLITQAGDILICSRSGSRALIGKNAKIDAETSGATFGAFMTIFRGPYNDYLHQVFNSKLFEYQSGAFLTSTINQLTLGILNNFKIPWPPLAEQDDIVQYISQATAAIDASIDNARTQVELMREYRASLIAHVVTGKLDVRAAVERTGAESS